MNITENLLQYIWKYKMFSDIHFKDTYGNAIEVLDFGKLNTHSGPDFSLAKIKTKDLVLVGDVEVHVKSSDWYAHHHQTQKEYQTVVLHVVFQQDQEIEELENAGVPTLILKDYIDLSLWDKYKMLVGDSQFIPCEDLFFPEHMPFLFAEELLLKKLDEKSIEIEQMLLKSKNNYEAVLFQKIAYAFGVKINAEVYQSIAESIDFKTVLKLSQTPFQLESLFYGKAGLLDKETEQNKKWKTEFSFLKKKFNISDDFFSPKFSRLMPASFPTVRLSQLAHLYHIHPQLFAKIINQKDVQSLVTLFKDIKTSEFWENHYTFDALSSKKTEKRLSEDFIQLLLINAILPVVYTYYKNINPDRIESILSFYQALKPEKNKIIKKWSSLQIKAKSALETQALLFQYKRYCSEKKCLNCSIGYQILKS